MIPRWLVITLVVVVSGAWLANLVVGWQDPRSSEPAVNTVFLVIIGSLFALDRDGVVGRAISRLTDKPDKGKRPGGDDS